MACPCNDANVWRLFYKIDPPQDVVTWDVKCGASAAEGNGTISTNLCRSFFRLSVKYLVVTVSVFCFCLPKHDTKFWFNVVLQLRCAGCNSFLDHKNSSSIITWERGRSTSLPLEQLASLYLCTPAMAVYYPSTTILLQYIE